MGMKKKIFFWLKYNSDFIFPLWVEAVKKQFLYIVLILYSVYNLETLWV